MGDHAGSRIMNVILRFFALSSAAIVAGIVGWALHRIDNGNGPNNGRLIYTEVVAVMSIVTSLILLMPFKFVFKAWPLDILLFIMWLIAFGLLADLSGTAGCRSRWYVTYWGWYWDSLWLRPGNVVSSRACGNWRAVLAFSGMSWIIFLCTTFSGLYVCLSRNPFEDGVGPKGRRWSKPWKSEQKNDRTTLQGIADGPATSQTQSV